MFGAFFQFRICGRFFFPIKGYVAPPVPSITRASACPAPCDEVKSGSTIRRGGLRGARAGRPPLGAEFGKNRWVSAVFGPAPQSCDAGLVAQGLFLNKIFRKDKENGPFGEGSVRLSYSTEAQRAVQRSMRAKELPKDRLYADVVAFIRSLWLNLDSLTTSF